MIFHKPMEAALVRIYHANGADVAGGGLLVTHSEIVTCAHVVTEVFKNSGQDALGSGLWVDFPLVQPVIRLRARVAAMLDQTMGLDVAKLVLEKPPQANVVPAPLCAAHDVFNHSCRVFGFTGQLTNGAWAQGILKGPDAGGLIQFDGGAQQGIFIDPGFSGCPVLDEHVNGIVGIVTEKLDGPYTAKTAWMIPTQLLLRAWGEFPQVWHVWSAFDPATGTNRWATFNQFGQPTWI